MTPPGPHAMTAQAGAVAAKLTEYAAQNYEPIPESGCWLWLGIWDRHGYGRINKKRGRDLAAHRAFYELFNGEIPNGLCVRHKCDTRACVNPAHLEVGTQADNMRDLSQRRRARGVPRKSPSLITREMRAAIATDSGQTVEVARRYGLSKSTVKAIRRAAKQGSRA